jgi:hypothetical protein
MVDSLINMWRQILWENKKSWVLFENGTCVILANPEENLERQATELIKRFGLAHAGTPLGDFSVLTLSQHPGWVVTYHHPEILNYVSPNEVEPSASNVKIGLLGRSKRHQDAEDPKIIHIEDMRYRV